MKRVCALILFVCALSLLPAQEAIALRPSYDLSYMGDALFLSDGGIVTVWRSTIAGDPDIFAMRFDAGGMPMWAESCPVVIKPGQQSKRDLILTSDGNYLITWTESGGVWGQLINPQGQLLWPSQGVLLQQGSVVLLPNQNGGVYILYTVEQESQYVLKGRSVNSVNNDLWSPTGIGLYSSEYPFSVWNTVSVSSGGYIINCIQEDENQAQQSYLLRFDALGNQVGTGPLLAPGAFPESVHQIRELGSDQYILYHVIEGHPCNLILQKMDSTGNLLLPQALSLSLPSSAGSSTTLYNNVELNPLSDGGMIIQWSYDVASINYQYRVQRLSPSWQPLWAPEGITVTPDQHNSIFKVREDAQQHFYCTWLTASEGNRHIKAQRVSPLGELLWGAGGVLLETNRPYLISPLGFCGAGQYHCLWFAWEQSNDLLKRQTLNSSGIAQLPAGGVPFLSQLGGYSNKPLTIGLADSFFTFWMDQRREDSGIYFQKCDAELNTYLAPNGKRFVPYTAYTQVLCQVEKLTDDRIAVLYYIYANSNSSYYYQIVDSAGEVLLPLHGTFVGNNLLNPVMDCYEGDVYVAWVTLPSGPNQYVLRAQRYVSGSQVWEVGGKAIAASNYAITPIGIKNRYFIWKEGYTGAVQSYVRRVDANGFIAAGWGTAALPIIVNGEGNYFCNAMGIDAADLIAYVTRTTSTGNELYAQKISPNGIRLWGDAGSLLTSSASTIITSGSVYGNGSSISYRLSITGALLCLQRLDSNGNKLFGPEGTAFNMLGTLMANPQIYRYQDGWYSYFFGANLNNGMDLDIFHRAINPEGVPSANGNQLFSGEILNQQNYHLAGIGNTAFLAWEDKRSGYNNTLYTGNAIYAAVMHSGGSPVDDAAVPGLSMSSVNAYPNPFRQMTTIHYEIKSDADVELDIYNLKGQKVRSLVSSRKSSGSYQEVFDGRDGSGSPLSSGIYILRLKAGNSVRTSKAILLK